MNRNATLALGAEGRRFESGCPDQILNLPIRFSRVPRGLEGGYRAAHGALAIQYLPEQFKPLTNTA